MTPDLRAQIEGLRGRFDAKWIPEPNTGCWLWTGGLDGGTYGFFRGDGRSTTHKAHRWSWMIYRGQIPQGLVIDHMCQQKLCVNPDHLRVVTHRINCIENAPRSVAALNVVKTHCPRGHPFSGYNLLRPKGGGRWCRECANEHQRAYYARIGGRRDREAQRQRAREAKQARERRGVMRDKIEAVIKILRDRSYHRPVGVLEMADEMRKMLDATEREGDGQTQDRALVDAAEREGAAGVRIVKWKLGADPTDDRNFHRDIYIEERVGREQAVRYAVMQGGFAWTTRGEWEYEPIPSSRDDAYIARARYATFAEALDAARAARTEEGT